MYHDLNRFRVVVNINQLSAARRWLNSIEKYYRNSLPGHGMCSKLGLEMPPRSFTWLNIDQLLPLAMIAMEHPDLVFRNDYWRKCHDEVFELGKEGVREGWTEEWLAMRFDEWLQDQRGRPEMRLALYERGRRVKIAALKTGVTKPILVRGSTARHMGDTYATSSRMENDRVFTADIRHLPSSDRKLRSMSKR